MNFRSGGPGGPERMKTPKIDTVLVVIAILMIAGGRIYQIGWHPEWTETEALRNLFWVWVPAVLIGLAAGFIVIRTRK